jgi:SAM-dependent methyltransferase
VSYLLFPGRHLVNTRFQEECLFQTVRPPVDHLVFAITSSNQSHSRYNPIPFHVRAIAVDRFARGLAPVLGARYSIVPIPHHRPTERFAELVLKEILEGSGGEIALDPANTRVLCSTPALIAQYRKLGYQVLTGEAAEDPPGSFTMREAAPIDVIRRLGADGPAALDDDWLRVTIHPASMSVLMDFPEVVRTVQSLYGEPLLDEEGSITESRDYDSYVRSMGSAIELKYADIKEFLLAGRIIDEGCADGALLARIAEDHPDSDLIGVDISAEMLARAAERQRAGEFSGTFVFFRQCNLMKALPLRNPVDTVICNSTLHEIWSYGHGRESVMEYLRLKRDQLRLGGRLVARDVVGPQDRTRPVLLWCSAADGAEEEGPSARRPSGEWDREELEAYLNSLSTAARFRRFAKDFLPRTAGKAFAWEEANVPGGEKGRRLSLQHAMEFITKMSYTDNWQSEMHEEFCFWELEEWKEALRQSGFKVLEGTRAYANEWRVRNSFEGRVMLYDLQANLLPFPATTMVLVGEKQ